MASGQVAGSESMGRATEQDEERDDERAGHAAEEAEGSEERDEIAARAYELYLTRGAEEGHALEDWLRAEAELQGLRQRQRQSA